MKLSHRFTAIALGLSLGAGTIASPIAAQASEAGKRNTAIVLGAAAAALLVTQKNKLPGIVAAAGAAYAYKQYNDGIRSRHRRARDYGYNDRYNRNNGYKSDRYNRDNSNNSDRYNRDNSYGSDRYNRDNSYSSDRYNRDNSYGSDRYNRDNRYNSDRYNRNDSYDSDNYGGSTTYTSNGSDGYNDDSNYSANEDCHHGRAAHRRSSRR